MWLFLTVVYVLGAAATARVVFTGESSGQSHAMGVGEVVLWPVYWMFFLINVYTGRKR